MRSAPTSLPAPIEAPPGQLGRAFATTTSYSRGTSALHGGFVWEWRDHGILTATADGPPFHAYGGDFGEVFHDGSFVCDGMVLADGTGMDRGALITATALASA